MPERTKPTAVAVVSASLIALALALGVAVGVGGALLWSPAPAPGSAAPGSAAPGSASPGSSGSAAGGESAGAPAGPPPALVRVGEALQQPMQARFEVVGRLQEIRRATVAAEVEGKVIEAAVDAGAKVVGGETVLARIDDVWAKLDLQAAEARVAAAQATLAQSRSDLAYLEQLAQANSARPREVEDARAQVDADQAAVNAAIAERGAAQRRVERLAIVAPFDGAVVEKLVEVGQWVEPGAAVAEIISTGDIEAVINVPERLINQVRVGEAVEVVVEPVRQRVAGKVVAVVPSGVTAARTFPVKVRLDDREGLLKPGMSVIAHLPVGESSPQLTVPRDAVLFGEGGATVWAAVKSDPQAELPSAMPFQVEVLFGQGERYAVRPLPGIGGQSLSPQMQVVIEGAEKLFPTQPLQILDQENALSHR